MRSVFYMIVRSKFLNFYTFSIFIRNRNGTSTMTRFAVCDAVYRAIWCLKCRGLRFAATAAVCGSRLGVYNKSGAANREPSAARRKTQLCLQYRGFRHGTRFAGRFLEMKKSFILREAIFFGPNLLLFGPNILSTPNISFLAQIF